jgi:hypothetical protein
VAQNVTLLEAKLAVTHQAWDTTEAKLPSLADKAADANR